MAALGPRRTLAALHDGNEETQLHAVAGRVARGDAEDFIAGVSEVVMIGLCDVVFAGESKSAGYWYCGRVWLIGDGFRDGNQCVVDVGQAGPVFGGEGEACADDRR